MTSIGSSAFSGCTGLTEITLPDSVISMGLNVFAGCPNLTNVSTSNGLKTFLSQYASQLGLSAVAVNNFSSTTESQINAMVATSLAGNAAFLSSLGTNSSFLGALSGQILATTNNYGLATKADLAALATKKDISDLAQQTSATNSAYVQGVATNPAFIAALVAQPSFLNTTATNATFVASLTTNPAFVTAVAAQILAASNNYGVAVKQAQSLNFPAIPALTITPGRKYTNNVTTSSGLPVTQASANTAVATVSNNVLTLIGSGSTTITASQPGNALWNPVSASQPLIVTKGSQTLTFTAIKPVTFAPYATVTLSCASSAGLNTTTFSIDNGSVGSISNKVLLILGRGTATITATNSGNAYFAPAFATRPLIVQ